MNSRDEGRVFRSAGYLMSLAYCRSSVVVPSLLVPCL